MDFLVVANRAYWIWEWAETMGVVSLAIQEYLPYLIWTKKIGVVCDFRNFFAQAECIVYREGNPWIQAMIEIIKY